jgi:hypothetical protein
LVGKQGRSGRKRKYPDNPDDPLRTIMRRNALAYYYAHKKKRLARMHDYHKENVAIMKYAAKHGISIPEARKIAGDPKKRKEVHGK